jgi:zinc finger HIT domain-containing protein 1
MQRTNSTDIPATSFIPSGSAKQSDPSSEFAGIVLPSTGDKGRKKQSGNVRKILYAKKSLKDWLEELVSPD